MIKGLEETLSFIQLYIEYINFITLANTPPILLHLQNVKTNI